ncbi:MAG: inositol-3-phosphate synthase [Phenylobacterium sp.]|uniref:inositol-3-phosphate synthase n=1 Tax=Phenylobacterium sp. TaxID=1871053 RepID=UPI003919F4E6
MARSKVRIGLIGVGNCASSLVQGLSRYAGASPEAPPPGLMNVDLGGYRIEDVEVACAFDVSAAKVGRGLAAAIFAPPNNTFRFADAPASDVVVRRGPTLDGIGTYMAGDIEESPEEPCDVAQVLRETGTEVLVSYLPVGSQQASEYYAHRALEAGCAFVNCIPVFLASNPVWAKRFESRGLPIVGDDIKSQVGATIVHRALVNLFRERGVRVDRTYQLNFGGNSDFKNMLERERLASKKISKTQAVTSQLETPLADDEIHVGPSDFVPWLSDRKWAHIRIEGTTFGDVPLNVELKLEVWDSPNSAGVVIDAVRCAKLGLDRRLGGPLLGPSSYFMKSPPEQYTDHVAHELTRRFIEGEGGQVRVGRSARMAS